MHEDIAENHPVILSLAKSHPLGLFAPLRASCFHDLWCVTSGLQTTPTGHCQRATAAPTGLDALPSVRPSLPPLQRSASDSTHQLPHGPPSDGPPQPMPSSTSNSGSAHASIASTASVHHTHQQSVTLASHPGMADAATAMQEPRMRLGLRVEQRVTVKHHVKALQQQLDRAAGDLQDAMEAIYTERHTKRQLAGQLADLQARSSESGVMQAAAKEADLTHSLDQVGHAIKSMLCGPQRRRGGGDRMFVNFWRDICQVRLSAAQPQLTSCD